MAHTDALATECIDLILENAGDINFTEAGIERAPILLKGDQHPRGDGEIPGRALIPTCYLKYKQRDCC